MFCSLYYIEQKPTKTKGNCSLFSCVTKGIHYQLILEFPNDVIYIFLMVFLGSIYGIYLLMHVYDHDQNIFSEYMNNY